MMKKSIMSLLVSSLNAQDGSTAGSSATAGSVNIERRYKDLTAIARHFMPDFDERKYWAYGCNCLILGDRPMSDPGLGRPVDRLDNVCKQYKDCQRCVAMKFGDDCIGEMVKYRWRYTNQNDIKCMDKPDTCKRALCECDLQFGKNMPAHRDEFNTDYHLFWSTVDWNAEENCLRGGHGPYEPACCGAPDGPMQLFNDATKDCCPNHGYSIRPEGTC